MSSCSSSSNIRSQLFSQTINQVSTGSRIAFNISAAGVGYTVGSGITGGSVIRYDPDTISYERSDASSADRAEVIGVVESYTVQAGITTFTVIANGLIDYPNLSSVYDTYSNCVGTNTLLGGAGGKDIYFLSDGCSGAIQMLEPTTPGSIVKPVIQALNVPNYNAIVLNYIGYEVGDQAQAEFPIDGLIGSITYVPDVTTVPNGYLDITNQQLVSVGEYQELYNIFDIDYGVYRDGITMTANPPAGWAGLVATQTISGSPYNTGTIISVSGKYVVIERNAGQPRTDINYNLNVGGIGYTISSFNTVSFTVPRAPTSSISFTSNETTSVNAPMYPLIKAKNNLSFVSVVENLKLEGLSLGNITDVENRLSQICAALPGTCVG